MQLHKSANGSFSGSKVWKWNLKYVSLVTLVFQNTLLVMLMGYSRSAEAAENGLYATSTAVVCSEFLKLACSIVALAMEDKAWITTITSELPHVDTLKLAIPGLLYTVQNNLLFLALSNLPAAIYQVSYQLKIITTALLSVVMLGRSLNRYQIISLGLLFFGVAMVQVSNLKDSTDTLNKNQDIEQRPILGLACVLLACFTSGFAGVYMEKVIKKGRNVSLYVRNIQLSLFGVLLGLFGIVLYERQQVFNRGFFHGYNILVWFVIFLQAFGGIMIAFVMKYADNILKGFATSISIVLSTWLSVLLLNFHVSILFVIGASVVIGAVFLYGYEPNKRTDKNTLGSWLLSRRKV